MVVSTSVTSQTQAGYAGVRMTAEEFRQADFDGGNYQLIDGVVIMSPSPFPLHLRVAGEIFRQLANFTDAHPVGAALTEGDVHLGRGPIGGDLVYKPDVVFFAADRLPGMEKGLTGPPDLVVEVISPGSRLLDSRTKKDDYERLGVREYWLIDPERELLTFYRLQEGGFVEVNPEGESFPSRAVPGFTLDLAAVRKAFKPWQSE